MANHETHRNNFECECSCETNIVVCDDCATPIFTNQGEGEQFHDSSCNEDYWLCLKCIGIREE